MKKSKRILIQIGVSIIVFSMLGYILPLLAAHSCEDDISNCKREWGFCQIEGNWNGRCVSGSSCYYGDPSPLRKCAVEGEWIGANCTPWFQYKDETKEEDCENYTEVIGPMCYFGGIDYCTSTYGWECKTTESLPLGGCCECTGDGVIINDNNCSLQYCGGRQGDQGCVCIGCNLNTTGDQTLDFRCELDGDHHLNNGSLTIAPGGSIVLFANSTFIFDQGHSINLNGGGGSIFLMSEHNARIIKNQ